MCIVRGKETKSVYCKSGMQIVSSSFEGTVYLLDLLTDICPCIFP